ncbi:unnamed protein product [Microthlaspi erraticum]|uniref:Uncharacterized protein n=1 Tax=Microthlaspi erraticum TaxID=1685480 RepID=A0A6D2II71_9BRAS|nr:unnamed protein product [Microthlaspi erraticum]
MVSLQSSSWTQEENKKFERALAIYSDDTPDRWSKVASMIPGKTISDVMSQYSKLEEDLFDIEAGLVPIPVIGSFSASGSTGAPGVPPVAEVQQRAAGFVQPQAVGLMVPSYLDMLGHMQRIGTPYFEGGVSPEAADEWRQRLERNFQSIRFLV